ncbi:cysteine-rich secretory protein LCCL domain-containing 2-like [Leptodactylus fuscus]
MDTTWQDPSPGINSVSHSSVTPGLTDVLVTCNFHYFCNLQEHRVYCPSGCISKNLSVWGTDTYSESTPVCLAAIHAGLVSNGGGYITVQKIPGQAQYTGSIRNGITSLNSKASNTSFTILATNTGSSNIPPSTTTIMTTTINTTTSTIPTTSPSTTPATTIMAVNIGQIKCYTYLDLLQGDPLLILCPPNCNVSYVLWGTDIYSSDSDLCPSAIHAGVITAAKGGYVTVKREPLQLQYYGTYRNGIQSLGSSGALVIESYIFL